MADTTAQATASPGETIRGKWVMDGATTLAEAADRLDVLAARLRSLDSQGWTLASPIADDYGFLVDPSGDSGGGDEEAPLPSEDLDDAKRD